MIVYVSRAATPDAAETTYRRVDLVPYATHMDSAQGAARYQLSACIMMTLPARVPCTTSVYYLGYQQVVNLGREVAHCSTL